MSLCFLICTFNLFVLAIKHKTQGDLQNFAYQKSFALVVVMLSLREE